MIYVFLAEGFEEIEALATADILRRAECDVALVGVGRKVVTGSHGIAVTADVLDCEVLPDDTLEAVVLPGGMPGTLNLEQSEKVQAFLDWAYAHGKVIGAICAAPSILGHKGLLAGRVATCFPGFEEILQGAKLSNEPVCADGTIVTAWGAGASLQFGLKLVALLCGEAKAKHLEASMRCVR